jgi:hypothetical protein
LCPWDRSGILCDPFYDFGHVLRWKKNELVDGMSETGRPVRLAMVRALALLDPCETWKHPVLARGMEPMRPCYLEE